MIRRIYSWAVLLVVTGCVSHPDEPPGLSSNNPTLQRITALPSSVNVPSCPSGCPDGPNVAANQHLALEDEVRDVQLARWAGFQRLARQRPDHDTLAVEIFRTSQDQTMAVITVVEDEAPVKYLAAGDSNGEPRYVEQRSTATEEQTHVSSNNSTDPESISLGHPPPTQPTPPGVAAEGQSLLSGVFGTTSAIEDFSVPLHVGTDNGSVLRAAPMSKSNALEVQDVLSSETQDVQIARWEGFRRLAKLLPDRQILAVEMFRTLDNQTVALLTVVQNGEPVRYAVTRDASSETRGEPMVGATPSNTMGAGLASDGTAADPSSIASGRPPPQYPVPPAVQSLGDSSLSTVFGPAN